MEAILATKDANGYSDGDIVEAFSLNRIRLAHAQTLTSVQRYPLDEVSGLRVPGTPLDKLLAVTHKYKYIINQAGILKVDLVTDDSVELDTDFTEFLARRRENPEHMLFGGSEITHWYGEQLPNVTGDTAWDELESCTEYVREDYSTWPLTALEKRLFLPITMTGKDITESGTVDVLLSDPTVDEFRSESVETTMDGDEPTTTVLARRRFKVPYWDLSETLGIQPEIARTQMTDRRTSEDIPHVDACVVDKEA